MSSRREVAVREPIEAVPHRRAADTFELRGSVETIKRALFAHLWLVFATTLVATGLVALYVWVWPPTFQAEVIIAADSEKDPQRAAFYQGWNVFRRDGLLDEATLMTSPPVLKEVIERLDLKYEDVYHPFTNYVIHLWSVSWIGDRYREVKAWFFPKKPNPYEPTPQEKERGKVLKDFQEGVAVRQMGEANIGLVTVKGSNQKVAQIANTLVDTYLERRRQRFVREAETAYESIKQEADRIAAELERLDREMRAFRSSSGMLLLFEKDRVQMGQWLTLQGEIVNLEALIAEGETELRTIDAQLAGEAAQMASDRVFQDTANKDRLASLEAQLGNARQLFQPDSREVRELEEQIRLARQRIDPSRQQPVVVRNAANIGAAYETLRTRRNAVESKVAGARASVERKRAEFERLRPAVERIPEKMRVNQEFERRQVVLESSYRTLSEKLAMAAVSMATARSAPPAMRVVEYAAPPESFVWPRTKTLLIAAAVLGAVTGVVGALLLELVFTRANRYRLADPASGYLVMGLVRRDEDALRAIYPALGRPRAPARGPAT